jgi:AcrR family transcriptional regulator
MTAPVTARRRGRPANTSTDDTVAAVLTAARHQFAAHGYTGTTNRSVADAAGLAHTAIYNHFGSKARLFKAVFDDVQDVVLAELARSVAAAPDEAPFPRALFDAVDALRALDPSYVEFLATMYAEVRRHPDLRTLFAAGEPPPLFDTLRAFAVASPVPPASPGGADADDDQQATTWFWVTFALGLAQLSTVATAETFAAAVDQLRHRFAGPEGSGS